MIFIIACVLFHGVYEKQNEEIVTELGRAAVRSHLDEPRTNTDGSVDIYFGPTAPAGHEGNWVQTNPGEGFWTCVRLYGPKKEVFDGSWKLSDIVEVGADRATSKN